MKLSSSLPHSGKNNALCTKLLCQFQIQGQILSTEIILHPPSCHVAFCQREYISVSTIIIPHTISVMECFLGGLSKVVIMIQQTFTHYLLDAQHCSGPVGNTEQPGKDDVLWSRSTMAF